MALRRDRRVLPIDAAFDEAVDRLEEIVAMKLGVKSEDGAAEQPVDDSFLPWADAEGFGVGPWDMPERDDRRLRAVACGSSAAQARSDSPEPARSDLRSSPPERRRRRIVR